MQNQVELESLNARRNALKTELRACKDQIRTKSIDNEIFKIDESIRFIRLGLKRAA